MRRLRKIFVMVVATLFIFPTFACLNEYNKNILGEIVFNPSESLVGYLLLEVLTPKEQRRLYREMKKNKNITELEIDELEEKIKNANGIGVRELPEGLVRKKSDYAVLLLRLGEIDFALPILEQLYAEYPQEYNVVANLGTAYELAGQDTKALDLLRKAIAINPKSHHGSEWIHVKILEAKIGLKANPLWLQQNPILGFDFGKDTLPQKNSAIKEDVKAILNLRIQLERQLKERMYFIKPKDVVVGDLLMFLGDLYSLYIGVKYALPLYQVAKLYTVSYPALLEKRYVQAKKMALLENPNLIIKDLGIDKIDTALESGESKTNVIESKKDKTPTEKNYSLYYILAGLSVLIIFILRYFLLRKK